MQKLQNYFNYLISKIDTRYNIKLPEIELAFLDDIDDLIFAYALSPQKFEYIILINNNYLKFYEDFFYKEIIPHELAHIVDYYFDDICDEISTQEHNDRWFSIATLLGASGSAIIAPPEKFHYLTEQGDIMTLTILQHLKLKESPNQKFVDNPKFPDNFITYNNYILYEQTIF